MLTVLSNKLTNSRMSSFLTCPRKHQIGYELGIRKDREAAPLRLGSAVHEGLDVYAQRGNYEEAMKAATVGYQHLPDWCCTDDEIHAWFVEREKVVQLLRHYWWQWEHDYEVLATEQAFEIELPWLHGFTLGGKVDKVVRLPDGRIAVMEHKTTSDDIGVGARYWQKLRSNTQIRLYCYAAQSLGYEVTTVIYDVIKKPSIGPLSVPECDENGVKIVLDRKGERVLKANGEPRQSGDAKKGYTLQSRKQTPAEYGERLALDIQASPDAYYARQEVPLLIRDLSDLQQQITTTAALIEICRGENFWPQNESQCVGNFGACTYLDLCSNGWQPGDPVPMGFAQSDNVHPELTEQEDE